MRVERIDAWPIGSTITLIARLHSRDGSGANTGQEKEGKFITAADVATITGKVYDRSSSTPDTSIGTLTITSASVVAAVTSGYTFRDADKGPYNWVYDMTTELISTAGRIYRVAFDAALTTGTVLEPWAFEAVAKDGSP